MTGKIKADLANTKKGVSIRVSKKGWAKAFSFKRDTQITIYIEDGCIFLPKIEPIPLKEVREIAIWHFERALGPIDVCWRREKEGGPLERIPHA